jgi:elongation factor Ts
MMDCKKALTQTEGDLEKAVDYLRKEGVVKAAKKAGRATSEGLIGYAVNPDKSAAALVEVNCETDFVANTDQFQQFLSSLTETVLRESPKDLEALQKLSLGKASVAETLQEMISKVGENMSIRRFRVIKKSSGGVLSGYLHAGSKIASIVALSGAGLDEATARDVAMHAAAMMPKYIEKSQVPAAVLEREKEVLKASPDFNGKPDNIVEKIITGKLGKFYSEICLAEQPFIKDTTGKQSVSDYLKTKSKDAQITDMVRFQVGEEVVN